MSANNIDTNGEPTAVEQPARRGGLSWFTNKEWVVLLTAIAVVIVGTTAAALTPAPSAASAAHCATKVAIASADASTAALSTDTAAPAAVPATQTSTAVTTAATANGTSTKSVSRTTTSAKANAKKKTTTKAVAKPAPPASLVSVGAVINFGSYGGAPLQWRVLDADATGFLLLSKYVVSAGAFQSDWEGRNASLYSGSEVRGWLKKDFIAQAFDTTQSAALMPHVGGPAGSDRVFLLSAAELNRYLPKAADRKAAPLASASQAGFSGEPLSLVGPYASWWLADPASDDFSAQVIEAKNGKIGSRLVYYADLGVRPAIRVNRDRIAFTLDTQGN